MCTALPSWLLKSCLVVLSMTLLTPLTLLMVCASICLSHSHTQGKAQKHTVCVIGLCFHLALVLCHTCHIHTHSVCECSVPRTSTSCEWVFSRDESTGECVLGCQSVLSSLFVFFSPLFHLLTLLSCPLFNSSLSPFFACTHQHLMPLLTHSAQSIDSPLHPMCVIHQHKHTHKATKLFLNHNGLMCASASVPCLQCAIHTVSFLTEVCVDCHSFTGECV